MEIDLTAILGQFAIFTISDGVGNAEFKTENGIQISVLKPEIQPFENDMFLKSTILWRHEVL
jgi:hypothetical protein